MAFWNHLKTAVLICPLACLSIHHRNYKRQEMEIQLLCFSEPHIKLVTRGKRTLAVVWFSFFPTNHFLQMEVLNLEFMGAGACMSFRNPRTHCVCVYKCAFLWENDPQFYSGCQRLLFYSIRGNQKNIPQVKIVSIMMSYNVTF